MTSSGGGSTGTPPRRGFRQRIVDAARRVRSAFRGTGA